MIHIDAQTNENEFQGKLDQIVFELAMGVFELSRRLSKELEIETDITIDGITGEINEKAKELLNEKDLFS